VEDDGKTQVFLWLCDVPFFHPALDGKTPEETQGAAWFRRKEVGNLDLAPKFREDWERGISLREHVTKALQRMVDENGEVLTLTEPAQRLQAVGSRWPYPRRSDGTEWPDAGPGAVPSELGSAGAEPPGHFISDGAQAEPHGDVAPRGGQDGEMPSRGRKPNPGPAVFPEQGEQDMDAWPYPQVTLTPAASPVGADTGVPPSGASKNDSGHPVVGSVPAKTPRPYSPHATPPEAFDPGEVIEDWSPEADSDVVHDLPRTNTHKVAAYHPFAPTQGNVSTPWRCASCGKPYGDPAHSPLSPAQMTALKGASDYNDANPVDAEHVYLQLAKNFPADAISWVRRASWVGPIWVPWDRIDTDDRDKWAASRQAAKVNEFAAQIKDHAGRVAPSVLVQEPNSSRAFIVDGHHRALAHEKLGQKVLAYLGNINPKDRSIALETHTKQIHQGADPRNK
jgi:hypothetical protein